MNTTGGRRKTSGPLWPELPEVPKALRTSREVEQWNAALQSMWTDFRAQLDRIGTEGRDISIVNGGATRILNYNGGGGVGGSGRTGATSGVGRRDPLSFDGLTDRKPSAEGGVYLTRLDGTRVFYQDTTPSEGREGDLWFDTDDKFRAYIYHNGRWQDILADVPGLAPLVGGGFDARAILAAADAQAEALLAESENRAAAIAAIEETLSGPDSSIARQFTVLNAELADARARITRESSVRATADEAIATDVETLDARVDDAEGAIVTERSIRAAADGSVIARIVESITASGGGATQTSGTLIIGATYKITGTTGADFTGVGAASNTLNLVFTATGTTPVWGTGSLQETRLASVQTWGAARITAEGNLASEYVLDVSVVGASGYKKMTGFRLTTQGGGSTGDSEFVAQAEKFVFVTSASAEISSGVLVVGSTYVISAAGGTFTGVGAADNNVNTRFVASGTTPTWGTGKLIKLNVPFKVTGDTVYIDKAVITEVTAGSILAGTISVALELTAATLTAPEIRSGSLISYTVGPGFWLGIDGDTAKFRIGDPGGKNLNWTGTELTLTSASLTTPTLSSPEITGSVLRLLVDSTICGRTSKDGILRLNGGGADGQGEGGQVDVFGNDYATAIYAGSVFLTPGSAANGSVRIRDRTGADRIQVNADGTVTISQLNGCSIGDISVGISLGVLVAPTKIQVVSTSDPQGVDAPLYSAGGAYVAKTLDVRGQLRGYQGSATAPALVARYGDDDTGIYSDEADKLKFACGGAQIARFVNSAGSKFFLMESGCVMRVGNTRAAITSETLQYYVTALDASGNTIKLAIVA